MTKKIKIVQITGMNFGLFGLGDDGLVYKWNPKKWGKGILTPRIRKIIREGALKGRAKKNTLLGKFKKYKLFTSKSDRRRVNTLNLNKNISGVLGRGAVKEFYRVTPAEAAMMVKPGKTSIKFSPRLPLPKVKKS